MKKYMFVRPSVGFVASAVVLGALAAACSGSEPSDPTTSGSAVGEACSLRITSNVYEPDIAWGTVTLENAGAAEASGIVVDLDVPEGVHCTNDAVPEGATLGALDEQSVATTSNHCTFTWTGRSLGAGES